MAPAPPLGVGELGVGAALRVGPRPPPPRRTVAQVLAGGGAGAALGTPLGYWGEGLGKGYPSLGKGGCRKKFMLKLI